MPYTDISLSFLDIFCFQSVAVWFKELFYIKSIFCLWSCLFQPFSDNAEVIDNLSIEVDILWLQISKVPALTSHTESFLFFFFFPSCRLPWLYRRNQVEKTHIVKTLKKTVNKLGNKANYCFICEDQKSINVCGLQAQVKIVRVAETLNRTYPKHRSHWKGTVMNFNEWQ